MSILSFTAPRSQSLCTRTPKPAPTRSHLSPYRTFCPARFSFLIISFLRILRGDAPDFEAEEETFEQLCEKVMRVMELGRPRMEMCRRTENGVGVCDVLMSTREVKVIQELRRGSCEGMSESERLHPLIGFPFSSKCACSSSPPSARDSILRLGPQSKLSGGARLAVFLDLTLARTQFSSLSSSSDPRRSSSAHENTFTQARNASAAPAPTHAPTAIFPAPPTKPVDAGALEVPAAVIEVRVAEIVRFVVMAERDVVVAEREVVVEGEVVARGAAVDGSSAIVPAKFCAQKLEKPVREFKEAPGEGWRGRTSDVAGSFGLVARPTRPHELKSGIRAGTGDDSNVAAFLIAPLPRSSAVMGEGGGGTDLDGHDPGSALVETGSVDQRDGDFVEEVFEPDSLSAFDGLSR